MGTRQVTVFGGSGFIGRYVVERLADQGWVIRVAVRSPRRAEFLKPLGDVGQIVPMRVPLQDAAAVRAAVEGVDAVINLTGILYQRGAQTFEAVQAEGAKNIAEAAAAAGVASLVHVSAIGADAQSASAYARTKAAGEQAVRDAFPQATILRPSIVYGPEDDFFNRFAAMARLAPALPLIGGGKTLFQPVYVGDVANAVVAALTLPEARGNLYELGGPKTYSFKELLAYILTVTGRRACLVTLPRNIALLKASVLEKLPGTPLLTRDQVKLLDRDNVVSEGAAGLANLGITPTALEGIVPEYLERYRKGGRLIVSEA